MKRSHVAVMAMSLLINIACAPLAFAQEPTTTTTQQTPSAPAADPSIPDFMKGYETTPTTTAVGPITPVVPHVAAPKAPPAAAQKPIVLKGRLEEISGSGATLPVGVLLGLKAQKGKMDPGQVKPKVDPMKGLVASFPQDWAGYWGGSLKVWWTQIDPTFWEWDREQASATADVLRKDSSGTTTFTFYQNGANVLVQPARITFPPRTKTTTAQLPANNPFSQMLGPGMASQMMQALTTTTPVVLLGDYQGVGIAGSTLNNRTVKNDIKQLKPGVLEQNIVTQENERKPGGEIKQSISETVIRFTKLNPTQLYVQAASLKYRNDGHFLDKVIFYGTVNRGVTTPDPTNPMMGMPQVPGMGSFPGMMTSPSGGNGGSGMPGLDGLNDLIRQMQQGLGQ